MFSKFVVSAFLISSTAMAFDFSTAEDLFAKRGEGDRFANIAAARAAFEEARKQTTGQERAHAVQRLNRLDYYEGLLLSDEDQKKKVFQSCLDRSDDLDSASVQYFYWKGVCTASWAQANGILASLKRSGEVENFLKKGKSIDSRYDGGGFDRVLAFVYLKVPAINPFGPTRDVNKALAHAEAALSSAAFPGEESPETATGEYFYNVYDAKAQALSALGRRDEAIAVAQEAISRMEQGDLPVGREPETMIILNDLKKTLKEISK
jgi:tetratricopeptide (TPR) repeat protein